MPALDTAYIAVKEGSISKEHFIATMKTAIETFCKKTLQPSFQPADPPQRQITEQFIVTSAIKK